MRAGCWATAALTAAALAATTVPAGAATPLSDVIVTLRDVAPAAGAGVPGLERDLRASASTGQRSALRLLSRRRAEGRVRLVQRFWVFDGLRVVAEPGVARELRALPGVASVEPNRVVRTPATARPAQTAPVSTAAATIGAAALWDRGVTGKGVVIASLDSGVDASHPALAAAFRGRPHDWYDPSGEHLRRPVDASGHGTATLGVMVGSGAAATPRGVAPGARWIAAKVFDDHGRSTTARIHAALQWALDPDGDPRTPDAPQVVNASWDIAGSGCDLAFEQDLRHLRQAGVLPVFAAGNDEHDVSPANNPSAFAVGAVDDAGRLAAGSGRGPSACGGPVYPHVVAPGVNVTTTDLFGLSAIQSGTSVAAPYVSGALALLLSRFPGISAERQAAAIESGADDLGASGPDRFFGHGRLDVGAALTWLEHAPDITLVPSTWAIGGAPGGAAATRITVQAVHGFTGRVTLSASAGLRGVRASFRAATATIRGARTPARLALHIPRGAPPGTYPLTLRARSGARTRSVTTALVVSSRPGPSGRRR